MSKNTQLGNLVNGIYVDSTGKVGVGTTSPAQKLDVYGRIRVTNPSSTTQFLEIYTDNGSVYYNAQNNSIQNTAYQHIFFTDGTSPSERMRITSAGNVGIGTDSPNVSGQGGGINVLTVKGSSSWGGLEVSNNSSTAGGLLLGFYGFTNSLLGAGYKMPSYIGCWLESGGSSSGGSLRFFTQSNGTATAAERMRITHDGNIAIGNTSPSTRLHVTGTISANDLTLTGSSSWSYTTNSSWTSHQQVVPFGALSGGGVYLIRLQWGGGASPYIAYGSLLWMPVQSNGGGTDPEVLVLSSTHQGGAGFFYARNIATGGQASSGLTIRLANFADPSGGITVTAIKLT